MAGEADDLIGDTGDSADAGQESANGALDAVNQGVADADKPQTEQEKEAEREVIKQMMEEYTQARDFDAPTRKEFNTSRRYAAGLGDPAWASDANLIGSFIDILVSFLYAQNPDVSAKAAAQVGMQPDKDNTSFAETMEIIISRMWKIAKLKKTARRQVRSALTVGQGWFKALMWSSKRPQPSVEKTLHDAESQMERIKAMTSDIADNDPSIASIEAEKLKLQQSIQGMQAKLELDKQVGLNVDFVRADDIQVSLDVASIADYLDADWISEDIYVPFKSLAGRFPRLEEDDLTKAVAYYQKNVSETMKGDMDAANAGNEASADGVFSKSLPNANTYGAKPVTFAKIIERWNRVDGMIETVVDGVMRWAVEPFPPPQATNRFYSFYQLAFYEVDGLRHPQSLPGRLRKLQDEYSAARSNQRLTRERSIPGLIANGGLLPPEEAKKLADSVIGEITVLQPTDINTPVQNIVMAKPQVPVDTRLWDTSSVRSDMESLSGVQEALQQSASSSQPKTATEAQIEQSGFTSRTGSDRSVMEDMLDDLAWYTGETALQEVDGTAAQRIAGPMAFWPYGMDIQDLLTLVNITIDAGSTGKPNLAADKANWTAILPLLQKMMIQIRGVSMTDPGMATALTNLLRETLKRMDDRLDLDDFIAQGQPTPPPPPAPPMPNVSVTLKGDLPPLDASAIGAKAAGLPLESMLADGGANSTAMQHASGMLEGELPPHPLMPQPLETPKKTPTDGGITQQK